VGSVHTAEKSRGAKILLNKFPYEVYDTIQEHNSFINPCSLPLTNLSLEVKMKSVKMTIRDQMVPPSRHDACFY
jgi:hypothetical protein